MDSQDCEEKERQELQRARNPVNDVVLHSLEDLPCVQYRCNNGGKTRSRQHDVSGGTRRISGALDSNSNICSLQGGGIIHSVTCHSDHIVILPKNLDDGEFVLWINLCKPIGIFNQSAIISSKRLILRRARIWQRFWSQDLHPHSKSTACFDGNCLLIAGDHFDINAILIRLLDGCSCVRPWWVQECQHAKKLPLIVRIGAGHCQAANTTGG
mmetsp:Transcript_4757/g.12497  ORF Transcript_4757/g.12497 Transcript_4757/m.12497 type:complete len:212 (-) Transcript_4757:1594-2229(-)